MKKSLVMTIFFIVLLLIGWLVSPYWMLYQINQAIENNQAEKISKYIDYARVQASLEPQIQKKMNQSIGLENNHTWIGQWGEHLTEQISHQVVQKILTPEAVALLFQGKQLKEKFDFSQFTTKKLISQTFLPQEHLVAQVLEIEPVSLPKVLKKNDIDARYISINTFQVIVPTFAAKNTQFIFQRHYVDWKLTEIHLN
ncbi:DUF2939 domain-containing protein [Acinetobacter sp. R933-2]|uniref:DUF2939 domain-containing protein n=1 Tax=Acinetobacter sp. R933-2 TaxID=2746728 RepID=UPI00257671DA|nr:DUF2939 domain-containing protein [Acinetobacter sp. R933-2]MDM1246541.1 DUF2939 domain-containing protein [Acinetobacter sp. R933-2]